MDYKEEEEEAITTMRAQCGLVDANNCKRSWSQRLSVPLKHGGPRDSKFLVTHLMTIRDRTPSALTAEPTSSSDGSLFASY
jgi:hypothetical protein